VELLLEDGKTDARGTSLVKPVFTLQQKYEAAACVELCFWFMTHATIFKKMLQPITGGYRMSYF
jgi:hypothetical protein